MRTEDFFVGIWLMRQWLNEQLSAAVKEPAASLLMGILIGERGNLPKDLTDNFQITGLTHILAISGFNITLIINLILLLLAGARKGWRWLASCLLIGFFVFLTGGSASVVRAAVMGVLALSVKTLGRKIGVLQLILMSTFLIVIMDPTILNFDLSFQLSLVATMSLVFFADFWELAVSKPWQVWVWEGISLTVAAQVLTLPLIFFGFGKISLISPISNLLIGPMIPGGSGFYVRKADSKEVYLIRGQWRNELTKSENDWKDKTVVDIFDFEYLNNYSLFFKDPSRRLTSFRMTKIKTS
jgi:competence protein ComEC